VLTTATVSADLNSATAAEVKDVVASISGGTAISGASLLANVVSAPASVALSCTYAAGTGLYTCSAQKEGAFNIVRSFRIWSGGAVLAPGMIGLPDSTQHYWFTSGRDTTVSGSVTRIRSVVRADTGTSVATRDTTPNKPVLRFTQNGRGNKADTVVYRDSSTSRTRTYITTGTHVVANLVRKAPEISNPYPFSGTITFNETVNARAAGPGDTNVETKTVARTAVVTFNGTVTATLVADGKTCDIDLLTKAVSNCR
jgi:hypothetical protein